MTTHNTNASAERVGKPRLTPAQRQAIAQARAQGVATKVLAARYAVSVQTIRNIARGVQMARVQARSETATVTARVPVADIRAFDAVIAQLGGEQRSAVLRAFIRHPAGYLGANAELAEGSYRLRHHTDLIPEHTRAHASITPPPPPKRRGRPRKNGDADQLNG